MLMFFPGGVRQAAPGRYRLVLTVDGVEQTQWLQVEADSLHPAAVETEEEAGPVRKRR